jgi:glucosylceramidase
VVSDAITPDTSAAAETGGQEAGTPVVGPPPPAPNTVDVWLTTGDSQNLLSLQPPLTLSAAGPNSSVPTIDVDATQTFQTVAGYGAAMTDSSAYILTHDLSAAQRQDAMVKLFDPMQGIGISYLRVPMGASDFSVTPSYTYDDVSSGTDPTLAKFSIDHDRAYILPRLKDAIAINPLVKIIATPWSPPAWMKVGGSLWGGTFQSQYYGAYAQYFVKFIQGYEAAGVPIDAVTLQNEPQNASKNVPSMLFTANEEADFVAQALGPAFAQAGIKTKIVIYDHNWYDQFTNMPTTYPQTVYANAQANPYIAGSAFHGYNGDVSAQDAVHQAYPDKDIYFTEDVTGGEGVEQTFQDFIPDNYIGAARYWARATVWWNIVLDQNNGPYYDGCTACRGLLTIESSTGAVTVNPEYYMVGHASKFIFPGAQRVASNTLDSNSVTDVAFVNPNGTRALLSMNTGTTAVSLRVRTATHEFKYSLPGGAAATFVWVD